jgi:hypothetical protein
LSLAAFVRGHGKALESDLLKYGYELKDIGRSLSWGALSSFVANLDLDSSVSKELNHDLYSWNTTFKTNTILADIFDILALINANIVAIGSHQHTKQPQRYPRPYGQDTDDGAHYGKDAVPVSDLREMFANKRNNKNGRQ